MSSNNGVGVVVASINWFFFLPFWFHSGRNTISNRFHTTKRIISVAFQSPNDKLVCIAFVMICWLKSQAHVSFHALNVVSLINASQILSQ